MGTKQGRSQREAEDATAFSDLALQKHASSYQVILTHKLQLWNYIIEEHKSNCVHCKTFGLFQTLCHCLSCKKTCNGDNDEWVKIAQMLLQCTHMKGQSLCCYCRQYLVATTSSVFAAFVKSLSFTLQSYVLNWYSQWDISYPLEKHVAS